jgi:hypothetical protein
MKGMKIGVEYSFGFKVVAPDHTFFILESNKAKSPQLKSN